MSFQQNQRRVRITYKDSVADKDKMTKRGVLSSVKAQLDGLSVDVVGGITVDVARKKLDVIKCMRFDKKLSNKKAYIAMVQRLLNKAQEDNIVNFGKNLVLDAVMGFNTKNAIKQFQIEFNKLLPAAKRIAEDSSIGPQTITALLIVTADDFQKENGVKIANEFGKVRFESDLYSDNETDESVEIRLGGGAQEIQTDVESSAKVAFRSVASAPKVTEIEPGESQGTALSFDDLDVDDFLTYLEREWSKKYVNGATVLKFPLLRYKADNAQKLFKYWVSRECAVQIFVSSVFQSRIQKDVDSLVPVRMSSDKIVNPLAFVNGLQVCNEGGTIEADSSVQEVEDITIGKNRYVMTRGFLDLSGLQKLDAKVATKLAVMPNLWSLDLSGLQSLENGVAEELAKIPGLRNLDLNGLSSLDGLSVAVANQLNVTTLSLSGLTELSEDDAMKLAELPNLLSLDLSGLQGLEAKVAMKLVKIAFSDSLMLNRLTSLDGLTVDVARQLKVRNLSLSGLTELSEDDARKLAGMPGLEYLDLEGLEPTLNVAIHLFQSKGLKAIRYKNSVLNRDKWVFAFIDDLEGFLNTNNKNLIPLFVRSVLKVSNRNVMNEDQKYLLSKVFGGWIKSKYPEAFRQIKFYSWFSYNHRDWGPIQACLSTLYPGNN